MYYGKKLNRWEFEGYKVSPLREDLTTYERSKGINRKVTVAVIVLFIFPVYIVLVPFLIIGLFGFSKMFVPFLFILLLIPIIGGITVIRSVVKASIFLFLVLSICGGIFLIRIKKPDLF